MKTIFAIIWGILTMILCGIDTDYTPVSLILVIVAIWAVSGFGLSLTYKK